MMHVATDVKEAVQCYHCGQPCQEETLRVNHKSFCCYGCKTVFEILYENDLCEYYSFERNPGIQLRYVKEGAYAYLDEPLVCKKVLEFDSELFSRVQFYIPNVHCISCIWLLENLQRLNQGIIKSEVNFGSKLVRINFKAQEISLREIAQLLASLGYAPQINLELENRATSIATKSLVTRLAVAGFCFGNIMLLSFPEYLGLDPADEQLRHVFSYLNVLLSFLVVFYSGQEYFTAAWNSFRQKQINIDVPIAVGLAALFLRSLYDIFLQLGPGYLDSLSGLVFFLLIGRWFQNKTYESLAFDRDYKSYFPLAVHKLDDGEWKPILVFELQRGDEIRIRNMEIVPADSILHDAEAFIDYSFVTGESKPVRAKTGDLIYAGGRLIGTPVILTVVKKTSQSHLTSLWNNSTFQKTGENRYKKIIDQAARRFTWVVLALAFATAMYWYWVDASQLWLIITSVLMVACPCALALAAPFTYGSMMRVFGKHGFYVKNVDVIERMALVDAIVFDKTGTITHGASDVKFVGVLDEQEFGWVKILTASSVHPMSNLITRSITTHTKFVVQSFQEKPGKGIEGMVAGHSLKIGSADFVGVIGAMTDLASKVFVEIDGEVRGYFNIETNVRLAMEDLIHKLKEKVVALLSGDNEADGNRMRSIFTFSTMLRFNQTPHDKLQFISTLQRKSKKVMMIGDGLNDSGALKQSDVGIAVTDDTGVFTPACDAILKGDHLGLLDEFLRLAKSATTILKIGFGISFIYNVIALSFAVSGQLTPLTAAVLMPISSISVVGFSTLAVNLVSRSLSIQQKA